MAIQNPIPRSPDEPLSYDQYLIDAAWKALASGTFSAEIESIPEPILVVLVGIRQWNNNFSWRERTRHSQAVLGHIRGILLEDHPKSGCISLDESHFLAFRPDWNMHAGNIIGHCRELVSQCKEILSCDISCCVGTPTTKEKLPNMIDDLFRLMEENITDAPILIHGQLQQLENNSEAQLESWRLWLQDEQFDQTLISVETYFRNEDYRFSSASLRKFNQDFIQMLYGVMSLKQVPAHIIFEQSENTGVFQNASTSIANTVTWIFYAVTAFSKYLSDQRKNEDYTHKARDYILSHLVEEFTRQDIADYVHLSQNHLARLFRQELGMSISDFILQERMKRAFEYLTVTSMPVYEVALQVGYENYSYFLTLFRRVAGMTPSQYRDKYAEKKREGET